LSVTTWMLSVIYVHDVFFFGTEKS